MKAIQRTPGSSLEERENYWMKLIERARAYPNGITAFCREHQVRKNNYYQWFRRLKLKYPYWAKKLRKPVRKHISRFIPMIVKDIAKEQTTTEKAVKEKLNAEQSSAEKSVAQNSHRESKIEVRLAKGHFIYLPSNIDKELLQILVRGLNC